jgi:hypothetical protein
MLDAPGKVSVYGLGVPLEDDRELLRIAQGCSDP